MSKKRLNCFTCSVFVIWTIALAFPAHGVLMPACTPSNIGYISGLADVVFKGKVISSEGVNAKMKVIQTVKGEIQKSEIIFRHALAPKGGMFMYDGRGYYDLKVGQSYLIFAKKTSQPDAFTQVDDNRCGSTVWDITDDKVLSASTIQDALWQEFEKQLSSSDPKTLETAIRSLDSLSTTKYAFGANATPDFDRDKVGDKVRPFLFHSDKKVVLAALTLFGSDSPYQNGSSGDFYLLQWQASRGSGNIRGIATTDTSKKNVFAAKYMTDLVKVADSNAEPIIRSMAIRGLGRTLLPDLKPKIVVWLRDQSVEVRSAAIALLADYPGQDTDELLKSQAKASSPEVRKAVAGAVGCGQYLNLIPTLEIILKDNRSDVKKAAAYSVLSFPTNKVESVLKIFLEDKELRPVFLNALAAKNAEPYLTDLVQVIDQPRDPKKSPYEGWEGEQPTGTSASILMCYVVSRDPKNVRNLNTILNALEKKSPASTDLYGYYLEKGLTDRATGYRAKAEGLFGYIPWQFDNVQQQVKSGNKLSLPYPCAADGTLK